MEASEVFGLIRELVRIGGIDRPGGELLRQAYGLMGRLRDCGFSGTDVSSLVGGRWGDSMVRRSGKGSGVVDVSGRDALLRMVGEFAGAGGDLEELRMYREVKAALGAVGLDWEGVAKLVQDLVRSRGSVESVVELSSLLVREGRTVGEVSQRIDVDKALEGSGLTREVQLKLLESASIYGNKLEILRAIIRYGQVQKLQSAQASLETDVERLRKEIGSLRPERDRLEQEVIQNKQIFEAAKAALLAGFDAVSLLMAGELAKDLGGPSKVVSAIKKYPSLKAMDDELESKKAELDSVKKEIGDSTRFLYSLNSVLAEAKKEYNENSDVRLVVELLRNPRGIKQDRSIMALLIARVLENGAQRIEENPGMPPLPDVDWKTTRDIINFVVIRLRAMAEPKAEEPSANSSL